VDREALDRARRRIADARTGEPDTAALGTALENARAALDELAARAAELETDVPERLGAAIQEGMRAEVLPVARNIAEVRGLSAQVIRRLERLQGDLDAERRARIEDLSLLVELVSSGWRSVDRRLDRVERAFDRLERTLDDRPGAELYRLEGGQASSQG
jgi:chromosome segregation ATPase